MVLNKIIAVDICNTLADVEKELKVRLGRKPDLTQYFHPGLAGKPNYFKEHLDIFLNARPLDDSVKVLRELSNKNVIVYITARPKVAEFVTRLWLRKNNYPSGKLFFSKNKSTLAKQLNVDIAIDDAPSEIDSYIKNGFVTLTVKQPYNIGLPNRFNWTDMLEDLEDLKDLAEGGCYNG